MSELYKHYQSISKQHLRDLFADSERSQKFSIYLNGLLFDYSKNNITTETLDLLIKELLAKNFVAQRDAMFRGDPINSTEKRAVLHTALRAGTHAEVETVLKQMHGFTERVRNGEWRGYTGKTITDIVNIGIGGSSLGPEVVTEALKPYHHPRLKAHFVANVEASDLDETLKHLSPETTLFIIASKTFTTAETMQNANIAKAWFLKVADHPAIRDHFAAVSTNITAATNFGIASENIFPFWDWVGGRYSVWSAIGLSVMLMIGADQFRHFLNGAKEMDEHFITAPLTQNIPVIMALIGYWYRQYFNYRAYAVIPYHKNLRRLPAFLQQLDMESNGKSVTHRGEKISVSGPLVFGETGTDSQHSFFQWLHQGTDITPIDFIAAVNTPYGTQAQQKMLLANCLAQSAALMLGQNNATEPHRYFAGNRPSNTFLLDAINPATIGMLLAAYEHKVFVQGVLWDINSFDQWGVELGKVMAKDIQQRFETHDVAGLDSSSQKLLNYIIKSIR